MRTKLLLAFMLLAIAAFGQQNPIQIDANGLTQTLASGGLVTRGQIVKINSSGQVVPMATADTSGAIGIAATSQQNQGQSITVSIAGTPLIQVDGTCAAGNVISISSTTGGFGHCAVSTTGQQIGIALSASSPGSTFWNIQLTIGGGGGTSGAAIAGNSNSIYASPACPNPSTGNCFFVNDNTRYVIDATWSNGATPVLITISGGDTPFTSADTGKTCYGIGGGGANTAPVGTFTFLTSTTGNCSGTSTGSAAANGEFVLGNDDTSLLNTAYTAVIALPHCGSLVLPSGYMMVSGPIFTAATPAACTNLNQDGSGINIIGQGEHATYFVPRPDATFAANSSLIGSGNSQIMEAFQVFGATATGVNTANKIGINFGQASIGRQVAVTQWATGGSFTGISFGGQEDSCVQCFVDTSGNIATSGGTTQVQCYECFSNGGLNIAGTSTFFDFGGVYVTGSNSAAVPHHIGGSFNGYSTTFTNGSTGASNSLSIDSASTVFSCEDCVITDNTNAGSQGIAWTAGGTVILKNSTVNGGATTGAIYNVGQAGATLVDIARNTFTGGFANWTGIWQGPAQSVGTCAMAAGTTCTITISGKFSTTAKCIVAPQSAAATPPAGACSISGTTLTITASAANSLTWAAMLGN